MQNYANYSVDLSNCESEPIHIIGRIQPHGFMLILNSATLVVEQVSENIGAFLQADLATLPGNTLQILTTAHEYALLQKQLQNAGEVSPQVLQLQGKEFFGFTYLSEGKLVVECELYQPAASGQELLTFSHQYTSFQSELNRLTSITAQAELLVGFVQQMLGYDRVMLYKFDEEWNGEVIAEKTKAGVHSYLHHHFPHSDIPAQARALLEKKHVRQISNVAGAAVKILPYLNPGTGAPINIIASELRNPSELHLEYLQNMGVQASLSASIIVQGQLWGIISCHHLQPVFTNYWKRKLCNVLAQTFTNAILAKTHESNLQQMESYKQQEKLLLQQVLKSGNIGNGLLEQQHTVLSLTQATGAALYRKGQLYTVGITPQDQELGELLDWLLQQETERVFYTQELSRMHPAAAAYRQQASGLLALEISKFNKEYLLFFKPEMKETRIWAGKYEPLFGGERKDIHPRQSFEKWTEVVKGKSKPWTVNEIDIAQLLLKDIVAVILKQQAESLYTLNQKLNTSGKVLKEKNKRLDDFAQIISHNLRSPINNMRGLLNLYNTDTEAGVVVMEHMQVVVNNMANTIEDLNLILKSEYEQSGDTQEVDLSDVVEKELQNLQADILETNAAIETELEQRLFFMPKVYLESIVHNLLSNALKYRSENKQPHIRIRSWQEKGRNYVSVSDNGLGMDLHKIGNKIFGLYATFHHGKDSKGLGLYITKMQTEALGGTISVDSTPDVGTTFKVCFLATSKT